MPSLDYDAISYEELNWNAAIDQGLGEFLSLDGWIVQNTGGFAMVAYYYEGGQPADGKSALAVTTGDDYDDTYQVWLIADVGNTAIDDLLIRKAVTLTEVKKLAYLLI